MYKFIPCNYAVFDDEIWGALADKARQTSSVELANTIQEVRICMQELDTFRNECEKQGKPPRDHHPACHANSGHPLGWM